MKHHVVEVNPIPCKGWSARNRDVLCVGWRVAGACSNFSHVPHSFEFQYISYRDMILMSNLEPHWITPCYVVVVAFSMKLASAHNFIPSQNLPLISFIHHPSQTITTSILKPTTYHGFNEASSSPVTWVIKSQSPKMGDRGFVSHVRRLMAYLCALFSHRETTCKITKTWPRSEWRRETCASSNRRKSPSSYIPPTSSLLLAIVYYGSYLCLWMDPMNRNRFDWHARLHYTCCLHDKHPPLFTRQYTRNLNPFTVVHDNKRRNLNPFDKGKIYMIWI